jgi:hypothetical protein
MPIGSPIHHHTTEQVEGLGLGSTLWSLCAAWALWIGDVSRQNQNIYISHWLEFIQFLRDFFGIK